MINIVLVAGIRPHYIKIGAIKYGLSKLNLSEREKINLIYVNSGQHYSQELSDNYIKRFNISFEHSFSYENKGLGYMQGEMLKNLSQAYQDIIKKYQKIDYVIVMGDVATTCIAGLATLTLGKLVKVVHIEGGLVTVKNRPEEYYRELASDIASTVFVSSKDNLEILDPKKYIFVGDIIYEYITHNVDKIVTDKIKVETFNEKNKELEIDLVSKPYVLASLHHKENFPDISILLNVFNKLGSLKHRVIFIAHPSVNSLIKTNNIKVPDNITIVKSLEYFNNVSAMYHAEYIVTDSGGMQRESYYLDKRCIVINDAPYWPSIIEAGSSVCVKGSDNLDKAFNWAEENKNKHVPYNGYFGDGDSVEKIFTKLIEDYEKDKRE